ncbi:glycosyltransferase [Nisaea acidiphila]|uniref:Glycosyltransferase n=1 Tax=Nisaea acidiphila TaxID=1862145 RepID=A0A9J7AL47_9PROT|nr:glycosyltransferase [Nisaea acidiphila]UUX48379.1 glycosyltransferase [Nisaea acidiphila]
MASDPASPDAPVHAIGWFEGRFGYNTHTRNFFDYLSRRIPVVASPMLGLEGPWCADRTILRNVPSLTPRATIALLYGSHMQVLEGAPGRRIAYTVWESTRVPDDWHAPLAIADEIWIPTEWGRSVLLQNGFPANRIQVVPEGVDPQTFNPQIPPSDALNGFRGFRFLNIGRYEDRKGTRLLIECFDKAFSRQDDAFLILACDNHHDPEFDIGRILRELNLRHPEKLAFIPPVSTHTLLAGVYRACDAFVAPFRAEGWGLPLIEAMACGLPVIATGYSGPTEFLGPDAYRIDFTMTDIRQPYFESASEEYGQWAEPDRDHLIALMREVYETRSDAAARGLRGSRHVIQNFSWDSAAEKAASLLKD